jgi:hypothetical protein
LTPIHLPIWSSSPILHQTCRLKGKTYRDAQLGELVHSIVIKRTSEHGVTYRGEPVGEKRGEGETSAER